MGTDLRVTSPLRHFPEMNPDDTNRGVYLGDGVYAHFDGYQIWLRTPREHIWHEIALEPPVLAALDEYRANLARRAVAQKEEPHADA